MPIEVKVIEGPPFRSILAHGPLLDSPTTRLTFQMRTDSGQKVCLDALTFFPKMEDKVVGKILFIGRRSDDRDKNNQVILLQSETSDENIYFIVFTYNTHTRKGRGTIFDYIEFFDQNPFADFLATRNPLLRSKATEISHPITFD